MSLFREFNGIPINRRNRSYLKKLAFFTALWLLISVYNGGLIHVQNGPSHLHVGVGATHSDKREVHLGVSETWSERLRGPLEADDPRVIEAIRNNHLHPPSSAAYNLEYRNKLNYEDMDSWQFLHKRIIKLFGDRPAGFFVEAGALDGQYLSNTLYLEKEHGWTGLLVEPNPSSYNELLKKNRRCWSSNTCLAVTPFPKEMVLEMVDSKEKAPTSQAMWVLRGSSFLKETAGEDQKFQANVYGSTYGIVQCFPFVSYLKALNVTKVDLFSLDIEGAEELVLATIPWDDVDITVLFIEHHGSPKDGDQAFIQNIVKKNYTLYDYNIDKDFIGDYIFVKNSFL